MWTVIHVVVGMVLGALAGGLVGYAFGYDRANDDVARAKEGKVENGAATGNKGI